MEPPYRLAVAIFRDSIRTFADGDCELARTLKLKDRELDAVTRNLGEKLVARATVDSELVPSYVDLILVARALGGSVITLRTSLRILSGVIKLPTFGIHTAQRKNVRRDFSLGTRRVFAESAECSKPSQRNDQ